MIVQMAWRGWRTIDKRLLWKFAWNCGFKSMRAMRRFEKRKREGKFFPPFIYISLINSCNLHCQGCWVTVNGPRAYLNRERMKELITQAKREGNYFFGLLGGEPFLHPQLLDILADHPDCYFQIFSNGHLITEEVAAKLRKLGNATLLISIEGLENASDQRRGREHVYERTLAGLQNCLKHRLITGVATSVCQSNFEDLVSQKWLEQLLKWGVHYVWYYAYRPVGPQPHPELALSREQLIALRRFIVEARTRTPMGIVDAYWDAQGRALCPMAMGISHHINPWGEIEPCPVIQFAREKIADGDVAELFRKSQFLSSLREQSAARTRGCILLENPELIRTLAEQHQAVDSTHRGSGVAELKALTPRESHDLRGEEIPEKHWAYRWAKKHFFFGFGAYG